MTAIFDTTTDYVVQTDTKGRMTYMNPAARRRTGIGADQPLENLSVVDLNPKIPNGAPLVRPRDPISSCRSRSIETPPELG